jgi:hypothetical protein
VDFGYLRNKDNLNKVTFQSPFINHTFSEKIILLLTQSTTVNCAQMLKVSAILSSEPIILIRFIHRNSIICLIDSKPKSLVVLVLTPTHWVEDEGLMGQNN